MELDPVPSTAARGVACVAAALVMPHRAGTT